MEELAGDACGACGVDAAPVNFALGADEIGAADGAAFREDNFFLAARVIFVVDDLGDLGDDVSATFDGDEVADLYAEAFDLVGVVKCGACDGGATDEDGRECGDGRDLAGAADLEEDVFELCNAGARGELVGDGTARSFAG